MTVLGQPLELRGVTLPNRIAMSPMCQYSAEPDGLPGAWQLAHLGARAVGGAGLILTEATAVLPEGRISPRDTGIWSGAHVDAWRPIVAFLAEQGSVPAIQLAHAGRKASTYWPFAHGRGGVPDSDGGWQPVGPDEEPFVPGYRTPKALDEGGIAAVIDAFAQAAVYAIDAGFQAVEVHAAHGYLLHEFYSPLTNRRADGWGGDLAARCRFAVAVATAVRDAVGPDVPVLARVSATDWIDGGWDVTDTVALAGMLAAAGVDLIDCSSGGIVPHADMWGPVSPNYQVPLAERVRRDAEVPTGAVGAITEPEQAELIVQEGQADLVLIGQELLRDPYWPRRALAKLGEQPSWPRQYAQAF